MKIAFAALLFSVSISVIAPFGATTHVAGATLQLETEYR